MQPGWSLSPILCDRSRLGHMGLVIFFSPQNGMAVASVCSVQVTFLLKTQLASQNNPVKLTEPIRVL